MDIDHYFQMTEQIDRLPVRAQPLAKHLWIIYKRHGEWPAFPECYSLETFSVADIYGKWLGDTEEAAERARFAGGWVFREGDCLVFKSDLNIEEIRRGRILNLDDFGGPEEFAGNLLNTGRGSFAARDRAGAIFIFHRDERIRCSDGSEI